MLCTAFGDGNTYETEMMVSLLLLLVAQLRRRVEALEERLQQREG